MGATMQYDEIDHLQAHHPAWVLLRSPHAPLILSFLARVFVEGNVGGQPAQALIGLLDDELFALNARAEGDPPFPRPAQAYLDEWASPEKGWLRKFYPSGIDEPHYDITPPVEKAVLWLKDLRRREFVGTESRLNTLFELLRQMVFGADTDPESQLADLRRRRAELDEQIARAERGEVALLDATSQRDRYYQFARNARELLADFREVEENFRILDRRLREQIAGWSGSKGALLDEALNSRNSITESDQGRSFQALFDFLLSRQRQAELSELLDRLGQISELDEIDPRLRHVHFDWIDAGERTQGTVRLLSEQLRRFLDDQVWLENRRIFDLLHSIEATAVELRNRPIGLAMELPGMGVEVNLPFERPLYTPIAPVSLESDAVEVGSTDFDATALLDQLYVDRDELARTVRSSLSGRSQVGLAPLIADHPLHQGLAELIGYLSLSDPAFDVVFDEDDRDRIGWTTDETERVADTPSVTFARRTTGGTS
ncbi:MAG TPA: DUF3375 domain-containing protein [Nocardioidaceae bacterium]